MNAKLHSHCRKCISVHNILLNLVLASRMTFILETSQINVSVLPVRGVMKLNEVKLVCNSLLEHNFELHFLFFLG